MRKSIRPLIAMTAALALTVTAGMSALAQADNTDKHFSVIEAASNEDSLTIPEIAKKCGTSVVAIETETKVVYNTYDNNYYNPFGGMFGYGYGYGYGNRGGRGGTQEYTQTAAGSGIIISEDGYVLTNNHVISGADKAEILNKVFFGPVTPEVPGSILQFHPDVTLICDEAAWSGMKA